MADFIGRDNAYNISLEPTSKLMQVDKTLNDHASQLASSTQIKGTTQKITFNSDGTVQQVQHVDSSNNVLRTDSFTYSTNLITEVRTVGSNTLTFKYHLDTLQTEVI